MGTAVKTCPAWSEATATVECRISAERVVRVLSWSKPPGGSRFFVRRGRVIGFFQDRHDLRFSKL